MRHREWILKTSLPAEVMHIKPLWKSCCSSAVLGRVKPNQLPWADQILTQVPGFYVSQFVTGRNTGRILVEWVDEGRGMGIDSGVN